MSTKRKRKRRSDIALASSVAYLHDMSQPTPDRAPEGSISTRQKYIHWASEAWQPVAEKAASVALAGLAGSSGNAVAVIARIKGK